MTRRFLTIAAAFACGAALSAYNPPVAGESLDRLTSPTQLTSASSAAGGGIFSPAPNAIVFNPALVAFEQRVTLGLDFMALVSEKTENAARFGWGFETGILVPSRWFVAGGVVKGLFSPIDDLRLGNSIGANAALAKEVSERISVGIGINGGGFWGANADWRLAASLGVLYRLDSLGFLRDFRVGVSITELGKTLTGTSLAGIKADEPVGFFPMLGTLRVGAAALLFSNENASGGFSLDLASPGFQNLIVSTGFQFAVRDILFIRAAHEINLRETIAGHANWLPSLGVGFRFTFRARGSYFESNNWGQSEMTVNAAWQRMYDGVNAAGANVLVRLGMQDTDPPVIELWNGEE